MFPACPGSVASFYQWSRGVQIRANLDLLMDWIQSVGLGDVASEFLQKLSAAVNLLATPKETLLQVRGLPVCGVNFSFQRSKQKKLQQETARRSFKSKHDMFKP